MVKEVKTKLTKLLIYFNHEEKINIRISNRTGY